MKDYYSEMLAAGDQDYPELEVRYCPKCGERLVKGSINYFEGFHFDGCPYVGG